MLHVNFVGGVYQGAPTDALTSLSGLVVREAAVNGASLPTATGLRARSSLCTTRKGLELEKDPGPKMFAPWIAQGRAYS